MATERWPLVGRGDELARLDEHLGGRSGSVVVAGGVGVGKSQLLGGWLAALRARGRATVVVRATCSTATIPFGAFAQWVPERLGSSRDRLELLQATAANLAGTDPGLVVAVDDAQLLDEGSAALVLHLAQHLPVRVVVAVRTGEPCPDAIVALWKEGLAARLDLAPLSQPQTAELVELELGGPVEPATQRRLWHLTEGNPLYLREIVDALLAQGTLAPSTAGWRWRGPLTGPTGLAELVRDRLGRAGSDQRRVLETVAVGEPVPADVLARLAPLDLLAALEARGLLVMDRDRPGPSETEDVRLAHPLYSEVLRAELPPFTTRARHRALAASAVELGVQKRDPLRVATWLLESGDETTEPNLLLRASLVASLADDFALSARLAEAADRAGGGWQAAVQRAEALGPLRRWEEADALLADLMAPGSDPEARAAAARVKAEQVFFHRGEDLAAARALVAEASELVPAPARASLLVYGARLALVAAELEESIRIATAAVADADSLADRVGGVTCAGLAAAFLGRTTAALAIVEMVAPYALEIIDTHPVPSGYVAFTFSFGLVLDGRVDDAATFFEGLLDHDVVRIGGIVRVMPRLWLARAALGQGRVRTATELCREALGMLGDGNIFGRGIWVAATLTVVAAQAGDIETATGALAWADAHTTARARTDELFIDLGRAWLHAARGEVSRARDLAVDVARRAARCRVWMVEMLALLEATRLGAAAVAAPRLGDLVGIVEGPYTAAAATLANGLASSDGVAIDDAAARFASMGARLIAAEAAAAAASVHIAAGRPREHAASLAAAHQLADRCEGAVTPMLSRLDHQAEAIVLTDRELEVAELAARGRTNREIAETLVVSVRTIDSHLNHAYTKLGISRRSDLATALGRRSRRPA